MKMSSLQLSNICMHVKTQKHSSHNVVGVVKSKRIEVYDHRKANIARIFGCRCNTSERSPHSNFSSTSAPKQARKRENLISMNDNISNTTVSGINILEFLRGKSYFITGVTGFLGKVVIEKILRISPEVGKIYVLIKADTREAAFERLKTEVIDSDIFEFLRGVHGKSYKAFMLSKVVPVAGNVGELNLGMHPTLMDKVAEEIEFIIHSAANTTFDERYDVSLNINTRGPNRILNFAKKCKKLCAFVHVSTAYVNREEKGEHIIAGKPFHLRESLPKNILDTEIDSSVAFHGNESTLKMKQLGFERARMYGWRNVYEFTKAMGEMLINENREEIPTPIIIVRPSSVESTYKEPYPGWIQGNRMLDPLILSYGQGYLPLFIKPEALLNVIPADMVANTIITAMAKHGIAGKPDLNIYHACSSPANSLMLYELFNYCYEHFKLSPMIGMMGKKVDIKRMMFVNTKEDFSSSILEEIFHQNGLTSDTFIDQKGSQRFEKLCKKVVVFLQRLVEVYDPPLSATPRFDMENTEILWEAMSEEEKQCFGFDVNIIDWKDFFMNIHVPGLMKHVKKK